MSVLLKFMYKTAALVLLFSSLGVNPAIGAADCKSESASNCGTNSHKELFLEGLMPAASTCAQCHPAQYRQWSGSQHAYAQLSPVFHTFQAALNKLTNNTNGDFCIRCHTPVGMNIDEPLFMDNLDRHPTSQEGITCITCHRVDKQLGKISGRLPIIQGDVTQPVYGPTGNKNVELAITDPKTRVTADSKKRGLKIHGRAEEFSFLSTSGFCATCHDVTLVNGFRLEEAFSEYKSSPAAARGESCQDCHMGKIPGVASGYNHGPAAEIKGRGGKVYKTPDRKLTDHRFVGPDYSVIHPGLFPHNPDSAKVVKKGKKSDMHKWLTFDYKAGWGTSDFEKQIKSKDLKVKFPKEWKSASKRKKAWKVIESNLVILDEMAAARKKLLQRGYVLGEPVSLDKGVGFKVSVSNGTDGHNVPTGFTGERLVWLNVEVLDAEGNKVYESGDLDPNGDVRDLHSVYVHNGELSLDEALFSLQSKFITRNNRGSEREQVLSVNYSPDPLPFLRPDTRPTILTGRTLGARIHKKSIEPLGVRWAEYKVPTDKLTGKAPYTATVRLKAAMIPVNLVAEIAPIGFDYGMSAQDVADGVIAGHQVLYEKTITLGSDE